MAGGRWGERVKIKLPCAIIQGLNSFEQNKKKPGLKFNPGLALIGLRTTGPSSGKTRMAQ